MKDFPTPISRKPEWSFYPAWVLLTTLCVPIALFLNFGIVRFIIFLVGDIIYVDGIQHITEDYLFLYTFIALVGLATGLLQYGFLRLYLPSMGWWVFATTGGWLVVLLLDLLSGWLNFWTIESVGLDVIFFLMGFFIGVSQWLLLRIRLPRVGWWIGANIVGWILLGLITGESLNQFGLFAMSFLPSCVTGLVLLFLINRAHGTE